MVRTFQHICSPRSEGVRIHRFMISPGQPDTRLKAPGLTKATSFSVSAHVDARIGVDAEAQSKRVDVLAEGRETAWEGGSIPCYSIIAGSSLIRPAAVRSDIVVAKVGKAQVNERFGIGLDDALIGKAIVTVIGIPSAEH